MPLWRPRRHVLPNKIVILMARAAFHCVSSLPVRTTANAHRVTMIVVALPGIVPAGVAIHAARVAQNGNDGLKRFGRSLGIASRINFFAALALRNSGMRNRKEIVHIG